MTRRPRLEPAVIAGVTLAGLVLRLLLWSTQSIVSVDGTTYIRMARSLVDASSAGSVQPWGYPVLIAMAHAFEGDWVTAARLVDLAAGVALIPLTWLLARRYLASRWLRIAPAVAVAALPLTVRYSLTTMSEAPYLAFLLGMFLLAAGRRPFPAGIAGGLAYLIRPEALTAVAVLIALSARARRRMALLAAGAAVVVVPYVVGQGLATGTWTLTQKTVNVGGSEWWENEPRAGAERAAPRGLGERVRAFGEETVAAYPERLGALGVELLCHGGWAAPVLALGGITGATVSLVAGLVQFLVTPAFSLGGHARFILPFLPFVWILAAAALERLPGRAAALAALVAAGGMVVTAVRELPAYTVNEDGHFPELVEAGEWLRPYVGPRTVVYDRKPYTAFYAGAAYRTLPLGGYEEILDAVVEEGGDFLVIDEGVVDFFRPALLPLALDKAVIWHEPRLHPVYVNTRYANRNTVVYRVVRPGGPSPLPSETTIKNEMQRFEHQRDHFFHGILAMRSERWQAAAGEFKYAVRADSTNTVAYNNRAWCLLQAGVALGNAEEDARIAVAREPGNPDYLDTLLRVLLARGKDEEAAAVRERIEALNAPGGGEAGEAPRAPDEAPGGGVPGKAPGAVAPDEAPGGGE